MSTYLVGFGVNKGEFPNEKTGDMISYSNRSLDCITDNGQNDKSYGFSCFHIKKIRMSDLACSLGVPERDDSVDTALKNMCKKEIELVYAPKNNTLEIVGVRPVFKK
ncbi:MAG: hypothetical protein K2L10_05435 [Ruminococcus sp.]|nr:hypothetical protein [Ruminococcus sp.]